MIKNLTDNLRFVSGILLITVGSIIFGGCKTVLFAPSTTSQAVQLPYLKNNANECYYLDDFMPTPDGLVSGRSGAMNLRYYSYRAASYKEWRGTQINLAFYSSDMRCWSLFEEFYTKD
ncbi:MAG: hypothetical protein NT027_00395 [Proteobacteria bacterium]|nr:hypothetical protein [Pseudomonadota bacterium]